MVLTAVQHMAMAFQCTAAPAVMGFGVGALTVDAVMAYASTVASA